MIDVDKLGSGNAPELLESGNIIKFRQVFMTPGNQEDITSFQRYVLQMGAFDAVAAADGQHIDFESAAKTDRIKRFADKWGISRKHNFCNFDFT